jgi:hypothetical protein
MVFPFEHYVSFRPFFIIMLHFFIHDCHTSPKMRRCVIVYASTYNAAFMEHSHISK